MRFTTVILKADIGLSSQYGARGDDAPMTSTARNDALIVARRRSVESFTDADLCPIACVEFREFTPADLAAARITLDIGGAGFGGYEGDEGQ